ncbi:MAG: class I SAM-dependent methyltransferase [Magnetococcales bacterium]|nr:class I SAM-dependent methyltransferase [Magnetococcales bacterium]
MLYSSYALRHEAPDIYDLNYYNSERYRNTNARQAYIQHIAAHMEQALTNHPVAGRKLLDIGCATGDFVSWASAAGWEAEGVDISEDAVAEGCARGLPLRQQDLTGLPTEGHRYDVVTAWDLLEHLPDMSLLLSVARSILTPQGVLVLKTVSSESIIESLARLLLRASAGRLQTPLQRIYVPGHLYYFTPQALQQFLHRHQWEILLLNQADTPSSALSSSRITQLGLDTVFSVQKRLARCYELVVACRPK